MNLILRYVATVTRPLKRHNHVDARAECDARSVELRNGKRAWCYHRVMAGCTREIAQHEGSVRVAQGIAT